MILIIPVDTKLKSGKTVRRSKHVSWLEHTETLIDHMNKNKELKGFLFELEDLESLRDFIREFQK